MGRIFGAVSVGLSVVALSAMPFERGSSGGDVAEYEVRVSAVGGHPELMVRVATVSADANGDLQVFERQTPFSWRVPESRLNVIAQAVTRGAGITVALERPGVTAAPLASGTGETIVLHAQLLSNGHGVVVLPR